MKYRIIVETERSGKKWFYVQKKFLLFFWRYLREYRDMSMYKYRITHDTQFDAEETILKDIRECQSEHSRKIISRTIIKLTP